MGLLLYGWCQHDRSKPCRCSWGNFPRSRLRPKISGKMSKVLEYRCAVWHQDLRISANWNILSIWGILSHLWLNSQTFTKVVWFESALKMEGNSTRRQVPYDLQDFHLAWVLHSCSRLRDVRQCLNIQDCKSPYSSLCICGVCPDTHKVRRLRVLKCIVANTPAITAVHAVLVNIRRSLRGFANQIQVDKSW